MAQSKPRLMHNRRQISSFAKLASCLVGLSLTGVVGVHADQKTESKYKPTVAIQHGSFPLPTLSRPPVSVSVDATQKAEIGLEMALVRRGFVRRTVDSPGQVQPNAELSTLVSTPSAGRAVKVLARLGDTVKAGQIMAVIKSDPIGQVQSDLLQNVLQAKADIKQQEVGLKLDRITLERESILFKEQVSAKADLQVAQNAVEKDEANLDALKTKLAAFIKVAQERLNLLGAPPDSAADVIATGKLDPWVIIRAPRAGLVIERTINPGEMNDGSKQLFTLANLSEVWLVANIFERDVQAVKKGQEAAVSIDSLPDHPFPAKIVWVGDSVNPNTRTLPVRANVSNREFILKPNMFARIKVNVGTLPCLLVPSTAVVQKGDESLVFVKTGDGKFTEREVKIGPADDNDIEIRSGLSLGESVVTKGSIILLGTAMKNSEAR
jgi:membrane fusion protein, heavy metal efflux system